MVKKGDPLLLQVVKAMKRNEERVLFSVFTSGNLRNSGMQSCSAILFLCNIENSKRTPINPVLFEHRSVSECEICRGRICIYII